MLLFRTCIFIFLQAIMTLVFSFVNVVLLVTPFKHRYKISKQWAVINLWLLEKICGVRYEVKGLENISGAPSIIMCKHQSAWETLALQLIFPQQVWVLKRELLWIPFFGWGLAALNPIAIDRGAGRKALKQIIEQGKIRLSSGSWVVIFPEGTRIPTGYVGRFGIGGAKLAVESGVSVIPVAHNAGKAWPKQGITKYPGTIDMVIGEAIAVKDQTASELNEQVYLWMEEQMTMLEGVQPEPIVKRNKR